MFGRPSSNKYCFKSGSVEHYVYTETPLTDDEQKILGELLASFPDSNHRQSWPEKFLALDFQLYPEKLLLIAANAYDSCGNTVLGVACEYGKSVKAVEILISLGADLDKPDENMRKLPMHWAINNKLSFNDQDSEEAVAVLQCLLKHGARTDITCYQNMTPLEYAQDRGFAAAARLIEEYNSRLSRVPR